MWASEALCCLENDSCRMQQECLLLGQIYIFNYLQHKLKQVKNKNDKMYVEKLYCLCCKASYLSSSSFMEIWMPNRLLTAGAGSPKPSVMKGLTPSLPGTTTALA